MMMIKPDHDRRILIPGVPAPVRRPVDIDQTKTGFTILRTLRIYRFDKESVIEGHAEEDEVFVVVIAGSVELTMIEAEFDLSITLPCPVTLSAPEDTNSMACVAYLPPHAAYKLVAKTDAEVAYARATPSATRPARVFSCSAKPVAPGATVLLEEAAYADRLRLRIVHFDARESEVVLAPVSEIKSEGLIHIRTHGEERVAVIGRDASPVWLASWDTFAGAPGESLTLRIPRESSGLALIVTAT